MRVINVAANRNGDVWAIDNYERLWLSPGGVTPRTWTTPTNGRAIQITANEKMALGINRNSQLFWLQKKPDGKWDTLWTQWTGAPAARDVSIGFADDIWLVDAAGNIVRWIWPMAGKAGYWAEPDPAGVALQVSGYDADSVYCINRSNEIFYLANNRWTRWGTQMAQSVSVTPKPGIAAQTQPDCWIADGTGQIGRLLGTALSFPAAGGRGTQVAAVDDNHVWAVNAQGQLWEWNGTSWSEAKLPFKGRLYVVQPGDWLSAIAQRFGVTVDAIVKANPGVITDPNRIWPGMELVIPG